MAYKKIDSNVAKIIGYWDWLTAWVGLPLVHRQKLDQKLPAKRNTKPTVSAKTVKMTYRVERRKYENVLPE